ncbi:MAG: hypothetical protein QM831_16100 [Kofleriaceae bacterium]
MDNALVSVRVERARLTPAIFVAPPGGGRDAQLERDSNDLHTTPLVRADEGVNVGSLELAKQRTNDPRRNRPTIDREVFATNASRSRFRSQLCDRQACNLAQLGYRSIAQLCKDELSRLELRQVRRGLRVTRARRVVREVGLQQRDG